MPEKAPRVRRKLWILPLAAVMALAVAVGLGRDPTASSAQVWWFPDSSLLALDGVTYGQQHQILHGTWWQKPLLTLLPAGARQALESRFGCTVATHTSARPNTLVLWIYRRAASPGMVGWAFRPTRSVVFDSEGHEFETGGRSDNYFLSSPKESLEAVEVPAFPDVGRA